MLSCRLRVSLSQGTILQMQTERRWSSLINDTRCWERFRLDFCRSSTTIVLPKSLAEFLYCITKVIDAMEEKVFEARSGNGFGYRNVILIVNVKVNVNPNANVISLELNAFIKESALFRHC